jgi:Macroglobulin domain MG4
MNTPSISKGATASWTITVKDANGVPVSGIPVTVWLLNQSWNAIDYSATATTNTSGVASFSTNATSSTGTYFLLLPSVDPSLSSYYYDSYQNKAWTTYFSVH